MTTRTRTADLRRAFIGILSRPGQPEQQADELLAAVARHSKQTTDVAPQRCQRPEDPHSGTALVGGQCPICYWRP